MKTSLLMLFCMVSQVSGQLIFKYVASRMQGFRELLADSRTFLILCLALFMYGLSVVLWLEALRHANIARLYMFFSLAFILVPVGAHFFFKEPLSLLQIIGGVVIIAGVALTQA